MADRGIKEIRKPRRTKGTVVGRYSNYVALGFIAVGMLSGILYHFGPTGRFLKDAIASGKFEMTEEEKERIALMSFLPLEKPSTIQKRLEDKPI